MHTGPYLAGSWHVVRLKGNSQSYERHVFGLFRTLVSSYRAAGAPQEFEVFRSVDRNNLYAYLSPEATALTAEGLEERGFKLIPLRRDFDSGALPSKDTDRLLPRA